MCHFLRLLTDFFFLLWLMRNLLCHIFDLLSGDFSTRVEKFLLFSACKLLKSPLEIFHFSRLKENMKGIAVCFFFDGIVNVIFLRYAQKVLNAFDLHIFQLAGMLNVRR